jgi:4,5-dihydroxyphthalate decarboxylase
METAGAKTLPVPPCPAAMEPIAMSDLPLTLAIGDYLHTRELAAGRIKPEGIDLRVLNHPFEQIAYRFLASQEWEVSEFSLATYCTLAARGNAPMIALPVFPSRVFRHGSLYVAVDSKIKSPADLKGRRVGIPQWTQTAVTYVRGWLQHDVGVPLTSIDWIQAGVNDPGRKEMAKFNLPPGLRLTSVQDKSLNELLLGGEIDAMVSARPPDIFLDGRHGVKRLVPDYREQERVYFQKTGIFPIMHVVVMRRDFYEANRWIARNLLEAFDKAKRSCLPALTQGQISFVPTAWSNDHIGDTNRLLFPDGDPWPYGVERNRKTLEPFLAFCHEQGVTQRKLAVEELFAKETLVELKI